MKDFSLPSELAKIFKKFLRVSEATKENLSFYSITINFTKRNTFSLWRPLAAATVTATIVLKNYLN